METVGEYITHASTQLNDQLHGHAFTRWGRGLLLSYLNLGLAEIAAYRPEVFAGIQKINLVEGRQQTINAGQVVAPIANEDGTPISQMDKELTDAFSVYDICPPKVKFNNGNPEFLIRSLGIDNTNQKIFYVDPPVPKGLDIVISVNVMGNPPIYTLEDWDKLVDLPKTFSNNLIVYMLAQAYRVDNESANSRQNSDSLFKQFYSVMGVNYKMQAKYEGKKYLAKDRTVGND